MKEVIGESKSQRQIARAVMVRFRETRMRQGLGNDEALPLARRDNREVKASDQPLSAAWRPTRSPLPDALLRSAV